MVPRRPFFRRPDCLHRFAADEGGAVLVLWGMFLAVAFGFLALTVDFGRVASTQSDLQSYADQVALAAAGELDGRVDAIDRARVAADRLISDWQTYAEGDRTLSGTEDFVLTFLTTLPPNDGTTPTDTTTDGRLARFVTVRVDTATVPTPFAAVASMMRGGDVTDDVEVAATATAGPASYACDVTPLMFCVPPGWRADANRGDQIVLRAAGQGAAWGPGNFGFLDPSSLPTDPQGPCAGLGTAQLYRCLVGAERAVTACIRTDQGVNTLTGQRVGLAEAFNTRFDHFSGSMQGLRNNPAYRPAPNTVQGTLPRRQGGGNSPRPACRGNNVDVSDAMPLPRDGCITAGTCGRFGDGNWNRAGYVAMNHNGVYPAGTSARSTRYEMYLAEIAAARSRAAPNNVPLPGKQETGAPQCHASGPSDDPARRTVVAAAVDCAANDIRGNTSGVVPLEYVQLFMTEPVAAPGGNDDAEIMVEVVRSAGGLGSGATVGIYREVVQLYR